MIQTGGEYGELAADLRKASDEHSKQRREIANHMAELIMESGGFTWAPAEFYLAMRGKVNQGLDEADQELVDGLRWPNETIMTPYDTDRTLALLPDSLATDSTSPPQSPLLFHVRNSRERYGV